jgi:hypothetical protein
MSVTETVRLDSFLEKFNVIMINYKTILNNIMNIGDDIKKLENIHHHYINSGHMEILNNSTYVDDIKHQIDIIKIEHDYISNMYQKNLNKLYRDLFKLYNKIVKYLMIIYRENKDILIKIWNSNDKIEGETSGFKQLKKLIKTISESTRAGGVFASDSKIFEEIKKKYYSKIKLYDEMNSEYDYLMEDLNLIYNELISRLTELNLSRELIRINLLDVKHKTDKGVLGQTFVMDLNGKLDRIRVDYSIVATLLDSIINIHTTLSTKYKNLSYIISSTVSYDEETITDSLKTPNIMRKELIDMFMNDDIKKDKIVLEKKNDNYIDNDNYNVIDNDNDKEIINKFE